MNAKAARKRLDVLLVERGLAESRHKAQAMILAGEVEVDGKRADKAGLHTASDGADRSSQPLAEIRQPRRLQAGRRARGFSHGSGRQSLPRCGRFERRLHGLPAAEWGGARLRRGREHGPIEPGSCGKTRACCAIKKNARELRAADLPEPVDLVVADVSFISVKKILPGAVNCAKPGAEFLILIKPQFELEREDVGKGGIVREKELHQKAIDSVRSAAQALHLNISGVAPSHLPGAEGNQEYFLHARKAPEVESQ